MRTDDASGTSYDELPYRSRFTAMSHPDRLATMAVLHGLTPPPVARCRVLEIGCADGGNLMTMAQSLPGASFVGIDLSARQVAEGRATAETLGFDNVELKALNLADVDESFGRFDYIVCHGVYSWVPAPVREKLLEVCARNLAPNGVAYVSYNVYPGWHVRGMVREMMLYHTRGIADPEARVREARGLVDFLARTAVPQDGYYALALKHEARQLGKSRDTYVFHEHLEADNEPVYFHEFVDRAAAAGLNYLAPARFDIREVTLAPEAAQALAQLGADRVRREQYLDFLFNRTFRQTLLCRAENVPLNGPTPSSLRALRFTALARPDSPTTDVRSEAQEPFVSVFGDRLSVGQPLLKAALIALRSRWPRSAGFDELHADVLARLERTTGDADGFATFLLQGHLANLVELHTDDPPVAAEPGDRPRAGALARRDAAAGSRVISLRGGAVVLQDVDRLILSLLDGTRTRADVVDVLASQVADGRLQMHRDGRLLTDPTEARPLLDETVTEAFQRLTADALFLAG